MIYNFSARFPILRKKYAYIITMLLVCVPFQTFEPADRL